MASSGYLPEIVVEIRGNSADLISAVEDAKRSIETMPTWVDVVLSLVAEDFAPGGRLDEIKGKLREYNGKSYYAYLDAVESRALDANLGAVANKINGLWVERKFEAGLSVEPRDIADGLLRAREEAAAWNAERFTAELHVVGKDLRKEAQDARKEVDPEWTDKAFVGKLTLDDAPARQQVRQSGADIKAIWEKLQLVAQLQLSNTQVQPVLDETTQNLTNKWTNNKTFITQLGVSNTQVAPGLITATAEVNALWTSRTFLTKLGAHAPNLAENVGVAEQFLQQNWEMKEFLTSLGAHIKNLPTGVGAGNTYLKENWEDQVHYTELDALITNLGETVKGAAGTLKKDWVDKTFFTNLSATFEGLGPIIVDALAKIQTDYVNKTHYTKLSAKDKLLDEAIKAATAKGEAWAEQTFEANLTASEGGERTGIADTTEVGGLSWIEQRNQELADLKAAYEATADADRLLKGKTKTEQLDLWRELLDVVEQAQERMSAFRWGTPEDLLATLAVAKEDLVALSAAGKSIAISIDKPSFTTMMREAQEYIDQNPLLIDVVGGLIPMMQALNTMVNDAVELKAVENFAAAWASQVAAAKNELADLVDRAKRIKFADNLDEVWARAQSIMLLVDQAEPTLQFRSDFDEAFKKLAIAIVEAEAQSRHIGTGETIFSQIADSAHLAGLAVAEFEEVFHGTTARLADLIQQTGLQRMPWSDFDSGTMATSVTTSKAFAAMFAARAADQQQNNADLIADLQGDFDDTPVVITFRIPKGIADTLLEKGFAPQELMAKIADIPGMYVTSIEPVSPKLIEEGKQLVRAFWSDYRQQQLEAVEGAQRLLGAVRNVGVAAYENYDMEQTLLNPLRELYMILSDPIDVFGLSKAQRRLEDIESEFDRIMAHVKTNELGSSLLRISTQQMLEFRKEFESLVERANELNQQGQVNMPENFRMSGMTQYGVESEPGIKPDDSVWKNIEDLATLFKYHNDITELAALHSDYDFQHGLETMGVSDPNDFRLPLLTLADSIAALELATRGNLRAIEQLVRATQAERPDFENMIRFFVGGNQVDAARWTREGIPLDAQGRGRQPEEGDEDFYNRFGMSLGSGDFPFEVLRGDFFDAAQDAYRRQQNAPWTEGLITGSRDPQRQPNDIGVDPPMRNINYLENQRLESQFTPEIFQVDIPREWAEIFMDRFEDGIVGVGITIPADFITGRIMLKSIDDITKIKEEFIELLHFFDENKQYLTSAAQDTFQNKFRDLEETLGGRLHDEPDVGRYQPYTLLPAIEKDEDVLATLRATMHAEVAQAKMYETTIETFHKAEILRRPGSWTGSAERRVGLLELQQGMAASSQKADALGLEPDSDVWNNIMRLKGAVNDALQSEGAEHTRLSPLIEALAHIDRQLTMIETHRGFENIWPKDIPEYDFTGLAAMKMEIASIFDRAYQLRLDPDSPVWNEVRRLRAAVMHVGDRAANEMGISQLAEELANLREIFAIEQGRITLREINPYPGDQFTQAIKDAERLQVVVNALKNLDAIQLEVNTDDAWERVGDLGDWIKDKTKVPEETWRYISIPHDSVEEGTTKKQFEAAKQAYVFEETLRIAEESVRDLYSELGDKELKINIDSRGADTLLNKVRTTVADAKLLLGSLFDEAYKLKINVKDPIWQQMLTLRKQIETNPLNIASHNDVLSKITEAIAAAKAEAALTKIKIPVGFDTSAADAATAGGMGGFGGQILGKDFSFLGGGSRGVRIPGTRMRLPGGAAFGSIGSMAGFGAEHVAATAGGLLGSLGGAAVGGGLLATAGLTTSLIGMGTDFAGTGQATKNASHISKLMETRDRQLETFGAGSTQAVKAQEQLDYAKKYVTPVAREATTQYAEAMHNVAEQFKLLTGEAQKTVLKLARR